MKVKIAIVQFESLNDKEKNLAKVEDFFIKAKGCDFIVFPEYFSFPDSHIKNYDKVFVDKTKSLFSDLSKKYNIYSIMGSIHEMIDNKLYNISYLFDRKGKIKGHYCKNNLTLGEKKYLGLSSGNSSDVFETELGKVGIQICRDLFYPEVTKKLAIKGADIIFCPSFWSYKSTYYSKEIGKKYPFNTEARVVDSLVQARAIENNVVFVFCNASGVYKDNYGGISWLLGHSQISVPFYGNIKILKHRKEAVLISEINLDILKDARNAYEL